MAGSISIHEAARWLAKMAGADGEITPNERKIMRAFAKTHGVDFSKLVRMAYAISAENEQEVQYFSTNEIKGQQFEELVVSFLADKSIFQLLAWRSDKIVNDIYAAENLLPDLEIKQRIGNVEVEYFVECKFRSSWNSNNKIDLSKQFLRYRKFAKDNGKELFIALGVGGTANKPDVFYMIPSRMFNHYHDVPKDRFKPCLCEPNADAYQKYVSHYFKTRVFKNKNE